MLCGSQVEVVLIKANTVIAKTCAAITLEGMAREEWGQGLKTAQGSIQDV